MTNKNVAKSPKEHRPTSRAVLTLARFVGLVSSIVAGVALALGTFPDVLASPGSFNWVLPPLVAAAVACGLAASWHVAMGIAAHADDISRQVAAIAFGIVLTATGVGTSSWFLAAKIGGATALQQHQIAHLNDLQKAEDTIAFNASTEEQLVSALSSAAASMLATAQSEGENGMLSGKPGFKKTYAVLQTAAGAFADAQATIGVSATARKELLANAVRDRAEAMRAIANRDPAAFEEVTARVAASLSRADKTRLSTMVGGLGIGLAMEGARMPIEGAINQVKAIAREVDDKRRTVGVPTYLPIDAKEAITRYPVALAWIASVLIEMIPLLMIAILLTLWRKPGDDEVSPQNGNLAGLDTLAVARASLPAAE